jgi:small subunit ribosomal protein S17
MAEKNEETPENLQEEVETAASEEGAGETTPAAADEAPEAAAADETAATEAPEAAAADEAAAAEAPEAAADADARPETSAPKAKPAPKSGPTRREQLETKRSERRAAAGRRKPRTPEEREAERRERRAGTAKQRRAYREKAKAKRAEARKAEPAREADQAPEHGPGRPKTRQGVVVSDKAEKTITVRIDVVKRHQRYHKIMRSSIKLYAHDERNDAHEGDTVRLVECRPMSRSKRWRLVEVLERAK